MRRGHKAKLSGGAEWDAFTSWRRAYNWGPGVLAWIKRRFNKRQRREARRELSQPRPKEDERG